MKKLQELREEYYTRLEKELLIKRKRTEEIISILRSYKGKYLGDGIQPNVDALEIANLLEDSLI